MSRFVAAFAVAAFVAAALPAGASIDQKIRDEQARVHATHAAENAKQQQLSVVRTRVYTLQNQLASTTKNIARVNASLGVLESKIHHTQAALRWNRIQLAAAQATVARHDAVLRRRLVDVYEHGDLGYLEVLLAARTFADFVERWNDIRYVIVANEATIRERRAAQAQVASVQRGLVVEQAQLDAGYTAETQQRHELDGLAAERANLLSVAQAQKRTVALQLQTLDESTQNERDQLEALIREKQAEEEAARRAAEEAQRRAALLNGEAPPPLSNGAPGALSWPVSGPITDPFGMRTNPVTGQYAMHTGIDIGAAMGTTITAPAAGKVLIAGWNDGGYGNMIVIDHGGGMSTLYGHCSQIFVSAGQSISKGQAIGAIGSTGRSTGPHLHFEVLIAGHPTDPMSYLR